MKSKKNILHLINSLEPEGAQTLLLNMLQFFNLKKYNIIVAYLHKNGTALHNIEIPSKIKIIDLSIEGKINVFVLFKIVQIIKDEKIDIIHTHLVHSGILGKIARKLTGVRYVISTRHYCYATKANSLLYRIEDKLTKNCTVVIAISEAVKKHLLRNRILREEKIIVIHNGINTTSFLPVSDINRKKNDYIIIGTIGRLHPAKGYPILLKAFKIVLKEFGNVRLEIVGDGPSRKSLMNLAENLEISSYVIWHGSIPHYGVIQNLYRWDLFVLSSKWEGFGLAAVEAMAAGLAVVASKVDGIIEIVDDGQTGYLFENNDYDDMAFKMKALLKDPNKRKTMGKNGREKVLRQFSIQQTVLKTEEIYDSLNSHK